VQKKAFSRPHGVAFHSSQSGGLEIEMTLSEYVSQLKDKRVAVLGIGISNTPLLRLLAEGGCDVTACDRRSFQDLGALAEELGALGVKLCLGSDYLKDVRADVVFRTPGILPINEDLVRIARSGAVITSEMEAFFSLCPCRTVAITGSDGKTTTSSIRAKTRPKLARVTTMRRA